MEQITVSLFDKNVLDSHNQSQDILCPEEAFVAITLAAIASNGHISKEKSYHVSGILSRMKLFQSYTNDLLVDMFEKLLNLLRTEGIDTLFRAAQSSLPDKLKESAFAFATDMVLSDGDMTTEEQDFLSDLYHCLNINSDLANQIVKVILIKNRGQSVVDD